MPDRLVLRRASQLIGEEIKSPEGRRLGTIYDLVLTEDHGAISYVALSEAGPFGFGRNLYAIPWSAMRVGFDGAYILPLSKEQIRQTHGFRQAYWPRSAVRGWVVEDDEPMYRGATREESREVQNRRVSRILGMAVNNQQGDDVADIEDVVVEFDSGRIAYYVTSFGGFFGLGEQHAAVPTGAITLRPEQKVARLNVSTETLQANAFTPGQFPDLSDPMYSRELNRSYGQEADWTALGYVAPEEEPATGTMMREEQPDRLTVDKIESAAGDHAAVFEAAALRTIQGTVLNVGKFEKGEADFEGLRLHVRTEAGETMTVYAGPRHYIAKQDIYILNGDRISVTGAPVQVDGRPVFLAAQISHEGEVLQLRNRMGEPLWKQPGEQPREHHAEMHAEDSAS